MSEMFAVRPERGTFNTALHKEGVELGPAWQLLVCRLLQSWRKGYLSVPVALIERQLSWMTRLVAELLEVSPSRVAALRLQCEHLGA